MERSLVFLTVGSTANELNEDKNRSITNTTRIHVLYKR